MLIAYQNKTVLKKLPQLLAPMGTASFCDEERRAKDIVDSGFPAPDEKCGRIRELEGLRARVRAFKRNAVMKQDFYNCAKKGTENSVPFRYQLFTFKNFVEMPGIQVLLLRCSALRFHQLLFWQI